MLGTIPGLRDQARDTVVKPVTKFLNKGQCGHSDYHGRVTYRSSCLKSTAETNNLRHFFHHWVVVQHGRIVKPFRQAESQVCREPEYVLQELLRHSTAVCAYLVDNTMALG